LKGILCGQRGIRFKEEAMSALRTRQEARERIRRAFETALDRAIPADESTPLQGSTFLDFEDQADMIRQAVLPTFLEERSAVDSQAHVERGGHCPHCGSDRVYLEAQISTPELLSPHGSLQLAKQHCRCRCCGGSFSPSGPSLGASGRDANDPQGRRASGAGDGGTTL
jgi:hypothetical protein